jgi:hypothetical protein
MLPRLLPKRPQLAHVATESGGDLLAGVPLRDVDVAVHGELPAVLVTHHRRYLVRGEPLPGEQCPVVVVLASAPVTFSRCGGKKFVQSALNDDDPPKRAAEGL